MSGSTSMRRTWWKTALGLVFTVLMLFPVYWMVNVSFTQTGDLRRNPPQWFPWDPTFEGYEAVFAQQLPALATSLVVGLGCVVLTVVIAAPAGYALALLNLRGGRSLNFLLLVAQMIPAVVMAMGFYAVYNSLGLLNTIPGLIIADSTVAVPFGVLLFSAFMSGIPRELLQAARVDGAGVAHLHLDRVTGEPQFGADGLAVCVPLGMVGLHLRVDVEPQRRSHPDHAQHLQLHRKQHHAVERDHGDRCRGVGSRSCSACDRPALRRGRCDRRRRQGLKGITQ